MAGEKGCISIGRGRSDLGDKRVFFLESNYISSSGDVYAGFCVGSFLFFQRESCLHMDTITTGLLTKLAVNFKHRTTLFVYMTTSLTKKDDERIENNKRKKLGK